MFHSSSFFGEFLFLILYHTEFYPGFGRECQLPIFLPHPPWNRRLSEKSERGEFGESSSKNMGVNFPGLMGITHLHQGWPKVYEIFLKQSVLHWCSIEWGFIEWHINSILGQIGKFTGSVPTERTVLPKLLLGWSFQVNFVRRGKILCVWAYGMARFQPVS